MREDLSDVPEPLDDLKGAGPEGRGGLGALLKNVLDGGRGIIAHGNDGAGRLVFAPSLHEKQGWME